MLAIKRKEENDNILYVPIELVNEFIVNPLNSLRDFANIPTNAISPFFTDVDKLDSCLVDYNPFDSMARVFDPDFYCKDEFFRYMHIDLAYTGDGIGISMCHIPEWRRLSRVRENTENQTYENVEVLLPFIRFDFVGRIKAIGNSDILISTAQDIIFELAYTRGFYIHLITFDRFQSVQTVQTLRQKGFNVAHLSVDRTTHKAVINYDRQDNIDRVSTDKQYNSAFEELRSAVMETRVEIPRHEDWEQETRGLEYLAEKDIVVKSPHSSDDLLQSIAGSAFNAANNEFPDALRSGSKLEDSQEDKTYEDPLYNTLYGYDKEMPPEIKHSNYDIGIG